VKAYSSQRSQNNNNDNLDFGSLLKALIQEQELGAVAPHRSEQH
jgi:hypothetical protein